MASQSNARLEGMPETKPPHKDPDDEEKDESEIDFGSSDSDSDIEPLPFPAELAEVDEAEFFKPTVERNKYRMKPISQPLTAPWGLSISEADVGKLKVGYRSRSMDNKWDLLIQDPDNKGGWTIYIIRNWQYHTCYILHVVPKAAGGEAKGEEANGATIESLTWEGNMEGFQAPEEQAKKESIMLCRSWLGCKFETLPEYSWDEFWKNYKKLG
ncbi:hypothetical protein PspLS_07640 [Pyricularia sp. CBS 133598]|nr:hypothetical protein PspLS_07640 [Pyricularia sp. CBS 133598]